MLEEAGQTDKALEDAKETLLPPVPVGKRLNCSADREYHPSLL